MSRLSEHGYLHAAGNVLEYRYRAAGRSDGPAIVLLHEGLGCCAMWRDFPERLSAATGLAAFSYSRAGYGRSSSAGLPWSVRYMHNEALDVLPAVLAVAGIGTAVLVGHSDGASIAAIYAGGVSPNAACGIILMAPHLFVEDLSLQSIAKARDMFETGDLRGGLKKFHGHNTHEAFNGWNGAWLDPDFRDWNITAYLADIQVPVLALQGIDDEYGTAAQLAALKTGCRAPVETRLIDKCGHAPQRDQPELAVTEIANFIARLPEICI